MNIFNFFRNLTQKNMRHNVKKNRATIASHPILKSLFAIIIF